MRILKLALNRESDIIPVIKGSQAHVIERRTNSNFYPINGKLASGIPSLQFGGADLEKVNTDSLMEPSIQSVHQPEIKILKLPLHQHSPQGPRHGRSLSTTKRLDLPRLKEHPPMDDFKSNRIRAIQASMFTSHTPDGEKIEGFHQSTHTTLYENMAHQGEATGESGGVLDPIYNNMLAEVDQVISEKQTKLFNDLSKKRNQIRGLATK